ncbi:hypothetical protein DFX62_24475, partial [Escherichia coli]|nr:hypothetical protein [Escherichia coli]
GGNKSGLVINHLPEQIDVQLQKSVGFITKQGDVLFVHYLTFLRRIFMTTTEEAIYYKRSFITIDVIVTIV